MVQKGLAVHAEIALLVTHVVLLLNDTNITINTAESSYEHTMVPVTFGRGVYSLHLLQLNDT